jgi:hypothetical protein
MAAALPFISMAFSAIGALQQGMAQSSMYKQQQAQAEGEAAMMRRNAQQQEINAQATAAQAAAGEDAQRRKARQIAGAQRAAISELGTGNGGTNLLAVEQSARDAELDALNIRYEGELKRRGLLSDAAGMQYNAGLMQNNAKMYGQNAKTAKTGAFISAGSSLLSGYADYKYKKASLSGGTF